MELSIATNNNVRAVETSTATSLLPNHYEASAKELVKLIKAYYDYLNIKNSPSYELNNLVRNHDIDLVEEDDIYIDAIERTVASIIPQSRSLDRKKLFKIISSYYNSRGSEESIFAFFRIFYNEIVTLVYPKEYIFESSTPQSISSNRYKLRDSYKWQEYSYQIISNLPTQEWRTEYLKFVHPAGLKLFVAFAIEMVAENDWLSNDLDFYVAEDEYMADDAWSLIDWKKLLGYHSPRLQANVYGSSNTINAIILLMGDSGKHYLEYVRSIYSNTAGFVDRDYLKAFYSAFTISYRTLNAKTAISLFRDEWQITGKFIDSSAYTEFGAMTIDEGDAKYNPGIGTQFNSYSTNCIIDFYTRSYLEADHIPGTLWNSNGTQITQEDSSYEEVEDAIDDYKNSFKHQ